MRDERLRVLLLTDEMEIGGTQRQIVHLARGLDRERFAPTVAYFRNRSFLADELEASGIPVVHIPKHRRIEPAFVRALVRFLAGGRFDVVHCFAFTAELWGAVAHACLPPARRPALITSVRNKYDWYTRTQWVLKRWAARRSCRVIANSRAGGEYARERMGLAAEAMDVVYNGVVDASGGAPALAPRSVTFTLQFVGRLVEQKNVPVLLRAMHRLAADGASIRLRIAGDGPLAAACASQIRELGLADRVVMLGARSDVASLMAQADAVVVPSVREGLSNVILEAMMSGRPVIASDVGGNGELVERGITGLLFRSDDDAALASAIQRLAYDMPLRARMGAAARSRAVERYSVDRMVAAMAQHYTQCTGRPWTA